MRLPEVITAYNGGTLLHTCCPRTHLGIASVNSATNGQGAPDALYVTAYGQFCVGQASSAYVLCRKQDNVALPVQSLHNNTDIDVGTKMFVPMKYTTLRVYIYAHLPGTTGMELVNPPSMAMFCPLT